MRALASIVVLLTACAPSPPCAPVDTESAGSEEARVEFAVQEGTLNDIARLLARVLDRPVGIAPDVVPVADCVSLTAYAPEPLTPAEIVRLVARTVEGSGIELADTPDGLVFRRAAGAELPGCARPTPAAPEPAEDSVEAQVRAGIDSANGTLSRRALNTLLEDQAALMRMVRVIPHEENGRVVGVRLYGIRRSSILGSLGFQNGDTVTRVNGFDITSPDSALQAYAALRTADTLVIELIRRGTPTTLHWRLID